MNIKPVRNRQFKIRLHYLNKNSSWRPKRNNVSVTPKYNQYKLPSSQAPAASCQKKKKKGNYIFHNPSRLKVKSTPELRPPLPGAPKPEYHNSHYTPCRTDKEQPMGIFHFFFHFIILTAPLSLSLSLTPCSDRLPSLPWHLVAVNGDSWLK